MADEFNQHTDAGSATEHAQDGASKLDSAQAQIKQAAGRFQGDSAAAAKADEFRAAASAKADDLRAAASLKAEEYRGKAEAAYGEAKVRAQDYHHEGEEYVRQNPTRAILGAVAAGFVLGLILRK